MAAVEINERYSDLCRLCGTKTTVLMGVNIFTGEGVVRQIDKKIETCLHFQIRESDELPKMICEHCLYKVEFFYEFRERAVRTQSFLIDLYKELNGQNGQPEKMPQSVNVLELNHPQFIVHPLLSDHNLDLHLEHRTNTIMNQEIILGHQNVSIDTHSLDGIDLNHHELTNQDISNHSLETQEMLTADAHNFHNRYDEEMHMLQQNQMLHEQYRVHQELHSSLSDNEGRSEASQTTSEIEIKNHVIEPMSIPKSHDGCERIQNSKSLTAESPNSDAGQDVSSLQNVKQEENSSEEVFLGNHLNQVKEQVGVGTEIIKDASNNWSCYSKCNISSKQCCATENLPQQERKHVESGYKNQVVETKDSLIRNHSKKSDDEDASNTDHKMDRNSESEETDSPSDAVVDNKVRDKKKKWSPKVCKECGKTFKNNYKLTEHMRRHTGEKPYKCRSCEKAFRSKIGLAQHEAKHTGQYDFACPTCGKGFQCKSYLMVHQRVHSDVKPYPCTTCGRNFKTKQSLLDHTNRHLGVKPYVCEICGRGFITKGLCKAHQKVHTGTDNRKYSCKVCNKMFVSKSYLQTHLRIHTGEKPFMCEVCGKGFLTRVDLRIHSTMHTGEKSYVCEICGKAFARRDALHCHRRSHTGERPYSCDLCGQTFTQFSPMAIHKRLHTGERPYACDVCGKTFVSKSTMMSHSKKHIR